MHPKLVGLVCIGVFGAVGLVGCSIVGDSSTSAACQPGADAWLTTVSSQPVFAGPREASNVQRAASNTCAGLVGDVPVDQQHVNISLEFQSQNEPEVVITGLRNEAGIAGWVEAQSTGGDTCMTATIDDAESFLSLRASDVANAEGDYKYSVSASRGESTACTNNSH